MEWKNGSRDAMDLLTPVVYEELRRLAGSYLRHERPGVTLQATALVHEAYLRLVAQDLPDWESRAHFFGVAAHVMRQVLVDQARRRKSKKRGGAVEKLPLEEGLQAAIGRDKDIEDLDEALKALAEFDPRKCQVIELRFFGGLSVDEAAKALNLSPSTIGREQRMAEAWLHRRLNATTPA